MYEDIIEKLNQEKQEHLNTKNELMIAIKEKEKLLNRIEKLAETISTKFSKIITIFYLPLLITMLNYYLFNRLHPVKEVFGIQIVFSFTLALTSIFMGVTGRGFAEKLRGRLKMVVNRIFGVKSP